MKSTSKHSLLIGLALIGLCLSLSSCRQECPHDRLASSVVTATCDQEGKTQHTCLDCGHEFVTDVVAPLGHTLKSTVFAPTCDRQGYTTYFCDCGYTFSADHTPPLGHALSESVTEATCEREGISQQSCENCDYEFTVSLSAPLGHEYAVSTVPVTCTHSGYSDYLCTVCAYAYRDYVHYSDLVPHAYVEEDEVLARGLDVSKYNHKTDASGSYLPLDWEAIRAAGFDYVILKIGSSYSGFEPTFDMDYAGARAAGLDIGVYFFTYANSVEENEADADHVIEWLGGRPLEYPIYFDIEDDSFDDNPRDQIAPDIPDRDTVTDFCLAFIDRIFEHGYYGALYCNYDWLTNRLDTERVLSSFDVWFARYPSTESKPHDDLPVWSYGDRFCMWQYTSRGTLEGFDGIYFDYNHCYKDFPSLIRKYGLSGHPLDAEAQ